MKRINIKFLALSGILTSITIILFALGLFIPFLTIITILGIPFAACLMELKTDIKYSLIYIISTILITTLINFHESLFVIIPSLITGLLFGIFIKRETHCLIYLLITSIISMILQCASIFLINAIYNINFLESLSTFFSIDLETITDTYFTLFFLVGLIQNILIFFLLEKELPKFNFNTKDDYSLFYPLLIISFICALLGLILNKTIPCIAYLMTSISGFTIVNLIIYYLKSGCKWLGYGFLGAIIINFFLFVSLNNYLETNGYYLLFNTFNLSICLIGVILIIDVMLIRKDKICDAFFKKHTLFIDEEEKNG